MKHLFFLSMILFVLIPCRSPGEDISFSQRSAGLKTSIVSNIVSHLSDSLLVMVRGFEEDGWRFSKHPNRTGPFPFGFSLRAETHRVDAWLFPFRPADGNPFRCFVRCIVDGPRALDPSSSPQYRPFYFIEDGLPKFAFVEPFDFDNYRRLFADYSREGKLGRDLATLTKEAFFEKYDMDSLSKDVFFVYREGLQFLVEDVILPDPPFEDDDTRSAHLDKETVIENRRNLRETFRNCFVSLSRREVSEVVYLAYAYGGEADGPAAYRTALRANPDILVPIPDGRMETELGRRVEAELMAPPEAAAPPPEAAEPPEPPAPEPLSKEEFVRLWVGRKLTPLQIGTEMQRYSMQEQEELEEAWRQGVRKRDAAKPKPWDLPESYPAKILPGDGYPGRLEPWPETAELKARLAKYGFRAGAFQRDAFPDRFRPTDRFFPTNRLPYLLLAPDRRPPKPLPMVVYFGGWGEQGSDLLLPFRQTAVFDKVCDPAFRKRHPCVLFAPMIERTAVGVSTDGGPSPTQELICDAMYAVIRDLGPGVVDTNRLYLTGLSYGGRIAYDLVCVFPDRFAATVPVAADEPPGMIPEEWPENVWTLRNEGERTTPEDRERRAKAKARVRAAGGDFRESEFPAEGHDAWHAAWREDRVWDWMFSKTRDGRPAEGAAVAASAPVPEPLAARCTASAPERDARHRPEHAVDGLDGTAFVSGRPMGKGDWLQVEFESPVSGRIVVRTGDGSGRGTLSGGRVETSVDGRLWTRRASVSSRTGEARFSEPGRIRFLRLLPEPKAPEVLVVREIEAGAVR